MVKRKQEIVHFIVTKIHNRFAISLDFGYVLYVVVILKDSLCIRMILLNEKERIEFKKDRI